MNAKKVNAQFIFDMNYRFILGFHKAVKYKLHICCSMNRWKSLNENFISKSRDELEAKMADALSSEIGELSTALQQILIDDMVTAFENRLNVFNRTRSRNQTSC